MVTRLHKLLGCWPFLRTSYVEGLFGHERTCSVCRRKWWRAFTGSPWHEMRQPNPLDHYRGGYRCRHALRETRHNSAESCGKPANT